MLLATAIGIAVVVYTIAIVAGKVPKEQRIDGVHFGIIVLTGGIVLLLLKPNIADRLKRFEGAGFKLEMLEQVKEKQDEQAHVLNRQANVLDDISLILPLLLPKTERKHLMNLDGKKTHGYKGNSAFRSELRRLRSIGLLEMCSGRHVGHMKSGMEFNLADYVRLTEHGHRWVERIKQIEEQERDADEHDDANDE
ncbi:MAG: hypothetical protein AAGG02_09330 [Cyanobacteria bacterium P01_H01_bin.15]